MTGSAETPSVVRVRSVLVLAITLACLPTAEAGEVAIGLGGGVGPPIPWSDDEPPSERIGVRVSGAGRLPTCRPIWLDVQASLSLAGSEDAFASYNKGPGATFVRLRPAVQLRRRWVAPLLVGAGLGPSIGYSGDLTRPRNVLLALHATGFVELGIERVGLRVVLDAGWMYSTSSTYKLARHGFELDASGMLVVHW